MEREQNRMNVWDSSVSECLGPAEHVVDCEILFAIQNGTGEREI